MSTRQKFSVALMLLSFLVFTKFDLIAAEVPNLSPCGSCELKGALKEGDWHEAKEYAEAIIAKSPVSPDAENAYLWLGLYNKSQYDYPKSTDFYLLATQLFPNTWTSAEAYARTGCNHYKLNDYKKALKYFQKAGAEAKTWQQRKYASAWSKHVHFALEANGKQLTTNCATKSIFYYFNSKEAKLDKVKLTSSLALKDGLVPLSEILKSLKRQNIKLEAIECPFDRIKELQLPFVAAVKPSHMIVINGI